MANVTQLKHLEHIEDEILNYGSAGCMASVSAMQELLRMLGKKPSSGYMQTKWRQVLTKEGDIFEIGRNILKALYE